VEEEVEEDGAEEDEEDEEAEVVASCNIIVVVVAVAAVSSVFCGVCFRRLLAGDRRGDLLLPLLLLPDDDRCLEDFNTTWKISLFNSLLL